MKSRSAAVSQQSSDQLHQSALDDPPPPPPPNPPPPRSQRRKLRHSLGSSGSTNENQDEDNYNLYDDERRDDREEDVERAVPLFSSRNRVSSKRPTRSHGNSGSKSFSTPTSCTPPAYITTTAKRKNGLVAQRARTFEKQSTTTVARCSSTASFRHSQQESSRGARQHKTRQSSRQPLASAGGTLSAVASTTPPPSSSTGARIHNDYCSSSSSSNSLSPPDNGQTLDMAADNTSPLTEATPFLETSNTPPQIQESNNESNSNEVALVRSPPRQRPTKIPSLTPSPDRTKGKQPSGDATGEETQHTAVPHGTPPSAKSRKSLGHSRDNLVERSSATKTIERDRACPVVETSTQGGMTPSSTKTTTPSANRSSSKRITTRTTTPPSKSQTSKSGIRSSGGGDFPRQSAARGGTPPRRPKTTTGGTRGTPPRSSSPKHSNTRRGISSIQKNRTSTITSSNSKTLGVGSGGRTASRTGNSPVAGPPTLSEHAAAVAGQVCAAPVTLTPPQLPPRRQSVSAKTIGMKHTEHQQRKVNSTGRKLSRERNTAVAVDVRTDIVERIQGMFEEYINVVDSEKAVFSQSFVTLLYSGAAVE